MEALCLIPGEKVWLWLDTLMLLGVLLELLPHNPGQLRQHHRCVRISSDSLLVLLQETWLFCGEQHCPRLHEWGEKPHSSLYSSPSYLRHIWNIWSIYLRKGKNLSIEWSFCYWSQWKGRGCTARIDLFHPERFWRTLRHSQVGWNSYFPNRYSELCSGCFHNGMSLLDCFKIHV